MSVIPAPHRHSHSSSTQSIGKWLIVQIDRLNLNCSVSSSRFPVKITNPTSVSNQLLRSIIRIIASNITISPYLGRLTYNTIMTLVEPAKFFKARDDWIFALAERETIVKASIRYWVGHQAFVQKLQNAKHSNKSRVQKRSQKTYESNQRI